MWSVNNFWVLGHIRVTAQSLWSLQFQDSTHKTFNIYRVATNSSHRCTRRSCRTIQKMDGLPNLITSEEIITLADVRNNNGELNPLINFPLRMCDWKSWLLTRFMKIYDAFHSISASHLIAQIIYQLIVRWLKQSTC